MKKISHWLLYASLFLLPWQTHLILRAGSLNGSDWQYGLMALYGIDILFILSFVASLFAPNIERFGFKKITYRYLLCGFFIFLAAAIPASLSPALSAYRSAGLLVAVLFLYALAQSTAPFRRLALAFVSGASLSALLGIWQFVSQTAIASTILGLAAHDSGELGASVIEAVAPDGVVERWLRAYGSLDHPNMLGGFLALALILASYLWLSRDGLRKRAELIIIIFSTICLSGGLIVSFSRGAWLAALAGLLVIAVAYLLRPDRKLAEFAAWAGCLIIIVGLFASQYSYLFTPRLSGDSRLEQLSTTERLDGARASLPLIKQDPFFGSGLGTYTLALSKQSHLKRDAWFFQPVHDTYLLVIAELGFVGAILLFLTIIFFLIHLLRWRGNNGASLLIALPLGALIIASLDHWLFSLHFGPVCAAALLGLLANYSTTAASESLPAPLTE